jgi:hypothetical protein
VNRCNCREWFKAFVGTAQRSRESRHCVDRFRQLPRRRTLKSASERAVRQARSCEVIDCVPNRGRRDLVDRPRVAPFLHLRSKRWGHRASAQNRYRSRCPCDGSQSCSHRWRPYPGMPPELRAEVRGGARLTVRRAPCRYRSGRQRAAARIAHIRLWQSMPRELRFGFELSSSR